MKKFLTIATLTIASTFFVTGCLPKTSSEVTGSETPSPNTQDTQTAQRPAIGSPSADLAAGDAAMAPQYTLDEVAKHSTAQDCWTVIEGKVYDLTKAIGTHPGGPAIVSGCGKDATQMFNRRPNGTTHSAQAREGLEQFYIGELKR